MDGLKPAARPKVTRAAFARLHECPGGPHDPVQQAISQVLEELSAASSAIAVAPFGCALVLFESLDIDCVTVPPGRAPAVAAGLKSVHPDALVICYQGGWDATSTGAGEVLHAAHRGDPITVIHTDLDEEAAPGLPLAELVAAVGGSAPAYVERVVFSGEASLPQLTAVLARALALQREIRAFGFVEVVSPVRVRAGKRSPGCLREAEAK
ncbi:MAG: hypothetical protein HY303_15220 [Candidatus Wallbacteria bacterium]|nr:hypothetical protein [Candidatus Wallbacteria bacterium]